MRGSGVWRRFGAKKGEGSGRTVDSIFGKTKAVGVVSGLESSSLAWVWGMKQPREMMRNNVIKVILDAIEIFNGVLPVIGECWFSTSP